MKPVHFLLPCMLLFLLSNTAFATTTIRIPTPQSAMDMRNFYKERILRRAMEVTEDKHGDFVISFDGISMKRKRALTAMSSGELMNVYFSPPSKEWYDQTLVVPIPLRRGILNYRLLLINEKSKDKFSKIKTLEELKKFRAGSQYAWTTTGILMHHEFPITLGHNFDGLFHMLEQERFDFFPRGIHEIYDELNARKRDLNKVIIAPDIALFMPSPTVIYVSPAEPELYKRLSEGMEILHQKGELKEIFNEFYLDDIKRAQLSKRTIIHVPGIFFTEAHINERPELWFTPKAVEYRY